MSLNTWMILGLGVYLVFVIYVGFLGAKKIKGLSDFAVAGESMGPIPLGLAFAASFFSAATFMGYVGFCYAWGECGLWIFLAIFGASTLGFIVLAKGVRNTNIELKSISMADWLAKRYNSDILRGLVSIVFVIQIFYIAGQFSAGGTLLSGMIDGLEYTPAIIIVTVVTVLYVTMGGLFADVYTSIGQMCLMMFAGVFVFVSGFFIFKGGLTEVSLDLAAQNPAFITVTNPDSLHMYSYAAIFGVLFIEFAFAGQPQLLNKIMALKNPKDMSKMIWTWIVASFCCLLVVFGGLYMRAIDPTLAVADNAVIEYVKMFHPIISTILSVAIIAALMSTACGLILVITTCLANDLFLHTLVKHRVIKMEQTKAEKVAYGMTKVLPALIGAVSLYMVFNPPPFMGVMVWIGISGVSAATLAPLIFALYLPRYVNATAAIIGAIVGEGVYFYLYLISGIERSVMAAGAWGVIVSFVVMFVLAAILNRKKKTAPEIKSAEQ